MAETFANNATGNLNAAITSTSATSFVLQAGQGASFPATGNFRVLIDSELMLVGARSGDTLSSVTRGIEGTAAATHLIAAPVTHLLTAGALSIFATAPIPGSSLATGLTGPPGAQVDYAEVTSNQTSTATTAATATAVITGGAVTYDGATPIWAEFQAVQVWHSVANTVVLLQLYDGVTDLGTLAIGMSPVTGNGPTVSGRRKLTPSATAHTFSARMWSVAAGTATAQAGVGGAGLSFPMYLKITKA